MAAGGRRARFISPPQELKRKAISHQKGLELALTPDLVAGFEAVVNKSRDRFVASVAPLLAKLRGMQFSALNTAEATAAFLVETQAVSYTIKGLGGTLGYPLATAAAKSLNDFVHHRETLDAKRLDVIRVHVDALYLILAQPHAADSATQRAVIDGLYQLSQRYA
jgi:hypothetical protein